MSELQIRLVREQITDFLRHEILTGKFEEGEPLREAGLAARFNVSRGPIRDALLQLTKEGLLEARRNCGARVGRVWDEDVRPVMANLRIEIETFAMRELMEHGPAASLKYFRDNLRNFEVACRDNDLTAAVKWDMEFHRLILTHCGHPALESVWLPIMGKMRLVYSRHQNLMESHAEHARIVAAIENGDVAKALAALKTNIH